MCFTTSKLSLSSFLVILWLAEWPSTSRAFPYWWGKFCSPGSLREKAILKLMKWSFNSRINQPFLSDKATNSSVLGVGHWTKQSFGITRPPILNSYILFLQDDCPKWLNIEFGDFPEITKTRLYYCFCASFNNYLIYDRCWFKLAFTTAFHLVERLWRNKNKTKIWFSHSISTFF